MPDKHFCMFCLLATYICACWNDVDCNICFKSKTWLAATPTTSGLKRQRGQIEIISLLVVPSPAWFASYCANRALHSAMRATFAQHAALFAAPAAKVIATIRVPAQPSHVQQACCTACTAPALRSLRSWSRLLALALYVIWPWEWFSVFLASDRWGWRYTISPTISLGLKISLRSMLIWVHEKP